MAGYRKYSYKKNYNKRRKNSYKKRKYTRLERLAYDCGRIVRGVNNENSKVHESYNKGCAEPVKSVRKPLI